MIINFENAASRKYVAHTPKGVQKVKSEMHGCSFLVLTKTHMNSVMKIPVANF